jgi:hypothetical protein
MYFFAAWPILYYALSYLTKKLFEGIEWFFFRESLFFLTNVELKTLWLVFFLLLLPWWVPTQAAGTLGQGPP